jgi:hypothetical protein
LNDNGLGIPVGQQHLDLWRQNYGNTHGAFIVWGSGTIPEPATSLLAAVGVAAFSLFNLRRARRAAK